MRRLAATFALAVAACAAPPPPNRPAEVVDIAPSARAARPPEISTAAPPTTAADRPTPKNDAACTMADASAEDRAAARELFARGVEQYARGDFDAALEAFRRADALVHAPTIALNIARCLHALGRDRDAIDALEPVARCPLDATSTAAFQHAIEEARRFLSELRSRP